MGQDENCRGFLTTTKFQFRYEQLQIYGGKTPILDAEGNGNCDMKGA